MSWKTRLHQFKKSVSLEANDPEALLSKRATAGNKDAGIYNDSGAGVFVRKNNAIDIYPKEGLGISINPDLDSITLYANKVNFHVGSIDFNTSDSFGLRSNKLPLNLTSSPLGAYAGFGTLLPYYTVPQDALLYMQKILGLTGGFSVE